ncbi:MAG: alpha/beta fold hydrolase [Myxococcales bacterium]|nr:alpha/beta fold hydrolase [Myxococcales bacterium]
MESIRIALGVEQLSYFGISAGTALGAAYAQRYPERVDRFVLDSSVSPYGGLNTMLGWQAKGADTIVGEWATWCSETKNCAVHDDPMGSLEAATQQATTEPLDVNGTRLTYGRMSFGAFWNLYSEAGWPALAKDLAAASSGDGSGLLEAERAYNLHNDSGGVDPAVAIIYLTGCADSNWQPTAGDLAEATLAGEAASGSGGGLSRLLWVDNLWCTALGPVANAVPPLKGVDAPPILMLQSRFDVATPLPGALVLQSELDNGSPMVVWEGSIHGAAFSSNCMRDHADVFFTTGALPADGETCD